MAGSKSGFWEAVKISTWAFGLLVLVVIMSALLVNSILNGTPNISAEDAAENTAPAGQIFYRAQ